MDYVIFNSRYALIALGVIALLYVLTFISHIGTRNTVVASVISVINVVAHIGLMLLMFYLKATVPEFLFVLVASAALSLLTGKKRGEE